MISTRTRNEPVTLPPGATSLVCINDLLNLFTSAPIKWIGEMSSNAVNVLIAVYFSSMYCLKRLDLDRVSGEGLNGSENQMSKMKEYKNMYAGHIPKVVRIVALLALLDNFSSLKASGLSIIFMYSEAIVCLNSSAFPLSSLMLMSCNLLSRSMSCKTSFFNVFKDVVIDNNVLVDRLVDKLVGEDGTT